MAAAVADDRTRFGVPDASFSSVLMSIVSAEVLGSSAWWQCHKTLFFFVIDFLQH
jgi:hypothetical protein